MPLLHTFTLGDMSLSYIEDKDGGLVGLRLVPLAMEDLAVEKECAIEPLVQLKWVGDNYPAGFSQGRTMRNSASTQALHYHSQTVQQDKGETVITTTLEDGRGVTALHVLRWRSDTQALSVTVRVTNGTDEPKTLEMLSSFTLGGLTPFARGDAEGTMMLHRLLSSWSAEGRLLSQPIETLELEPSWACVSANDVRYGQAGSMPVRGYYPLIGISDTKNKVTWAASLTHAYSWQLEAYRQDAGLSISGGMGDRELAHFHKTLLPGESLTAPEAFLTCVEGTIDIACQRLTGMMKPRLVIPEADRDLPVLFNEYCTTWGRPSHALIKKIASTLMTRDLRYFVIDAGWYAENHQDWGATVGDWQVSHDLFPDGIDAALADIRDCGMLPGIWFEFEVCATGAALYAKEEWLLKRDGVPIQSGMRRFLDFSNPEVVAYLQERVIDFLREHHIAYVKVDYNETIGIGCDGAESQGEGLRRQILCVQSFFRRIHEQLPELVLEVCSSGGHRLCPSFMELCAMASFSDAHECDEIPIIAKNMHRMILPRQSQIWVVIKSEHPLQKLYYQMTSAMLGRICLSGDVLNLSAAQWRVVDAGIDFYKRISPVIEDGVSRFEGTEILSMRHPKGWQAVIRTGPAGTLAVVHTFRDGPEQLSLSLPSMGGAPEVYAREGLSVSQQGGQILFNNLKDFDGAAVFIPRAQ